MTSSASPRSSAVEPASLAPPSPLSPMASLASLAVRDRLTHDLGRHYDSLRALRNRRQLLKSPLYAEIKDELMRVLSGVEVGVHPAPRLGPAASEKPAQQAARAPLRVAAWNIQRGQKLDGLLNALRTEPSLRTADVLLLSEVDCGMGRSNNRHVAAELAAALGMHYAFGVSYLVLGDDFLENPEGKPNTLALAGAAILSRFPIGRVDNVDLPELRDKFSSRREKRLGKKRALLCELKLPDGPLLCAACHLDSNASPRQRADQLEALLARASALADSGHGDSGRAVGHPLPILIGGDLNTTTYDASGPLSLFLDLLHKFLFTGFNQTVEGYMQPELGYDRPLFDVLTRHGFAIEGFNERGHGTYFYDVMSPYAVQKLYSKVGRWPTHWLQRRLRPWNGVVPARLDWFAGRGLNPVGCEVVAVQGQDGLPLSDHSPIVVDILPS